MPEVIKYNFHIESCLKPNFDELSFLKYKSSRFRIINERKQPSNSENDGRISDKFSV